MAAPRRRLSNDAARFLAHASFGATAAEIAKVTAMGMPAYVDAQLLMPATPLPVFAVVPENQPANCTSPLTAGGPADPFGTNCPRDLYSTFAVQRAFAANALTAPDQLRQRVAWALSQIIVTSATQDNIAYPMRNYQQLLLDNAFGNFRTILYKVSVDPFMGNYLDMVNNAKANPAAGTSPNENYAREIMQLFSIGLVMLQPDGSPLIDPTTSLPYPDVHPVGYHRALGPVYRMDVRADRPGGPEVRQHDQLRERDDAVRRGRPIAARPTSTTRP